MLNEINIDNITQDEIDLAHEEEKLTEEASKPSTKNYWDAFNPIAPAGTRPENRMAGGVLQSLLGGGMGEESAWYADPFNPEDVRIKDILANSDTETKNAIYRDAISTEHAIQIANLRGVRKDAYEAVSHDSLGANIVGGILPAMASPFMLAPTSVLMTSVRLGKAASIMAGIVETGALSAGAAIGDELLAGSQGMEEHKLAAGIGAAIGGGGTRAFIHILSGALGTTNAKIILSQSDTWTADMVKDSNFYYFSEGGAPKLSLAPQGIKGSKPYLQAEGSTHLERMHKTLIDKIPFVSDFFAAGPIKVYMAESAVGRHVMSKIVSPVKAMYDAAGNAVAVGRTMVDFKLSRFGVFGEFQKAFGKHMMEAKEAGLFKNRATFTKEVSEFYHSLANKQSKDLALHLQQEGNKFDNTYGDALTALQRKEVLSGEPPKVRTPEEEMRVADSLHTSERSRAMKAAKEDFYSKYKTDWNHPNPHIGRAAESAHKFFGEHLKTNKQLKMTGTMHTHNNKLYAPRLLNHKLFNNQGFMTKEAVATFRADVERAFKNHAGNDDLSPAELQMLVDDYVEIASNIEQRMIFTHNSFLSPTLSGDARMKGRKFDMDMDIMGKYMETDIESLIGKYQYQMSGRQALYFGFGSDNISNGKTNIMAKIAEEMMTKEGKIDKDVLENISKTLEDVSGNLRMNALSHTPQWTFTRNVQMLNSSRMLGGSGGNQFIELMTNMLMGPTSSMLKAGLGKSLKQSVKLFNQDTRAADEMSNVLIWSGLLEDGLAINHANRYSDVELGWNSGSVEKFNSGMSEGLQKWNFMKFFKNTMEHLTGGAVVEEIPKMAKLLSEGRLTGADAARAARWGLTSNNLHKLSSELELFKQGGLQAMDQEGKDLFQLAIQRAVTENVIQGNSVHIPNWMKIPTPAKVLLTQFMRFPIIAHNTLLQRGFSEEKAKMVSASLGSIVVFMGIKYLREQAALHAGLIEEYDMKYNYFADGIQGEEALKTGLMNSVSYIAPLGMFGTLGDYSSSLITGNRMGSDYRKNADFGSLMGVTFSGAETVMDIMQQPFTGATTDEKFMLNIKSLIPFNNYPLFDEAVKYGIHKHF